MMRLSYVERESPHPSPPPSPHTDETFESKLIELGIKNSYPTTGRIYGNYSPSSSSEIIIEHDYATLEPGDVYCLNKFGGDKMSEYFNMHVLEGLDGEYR